MFAGCGLKEVELYMPEMLNSNSMFEGCDKLQHIKIKMNKC
jgi:hypothetical protein